MKPISDVNLQAFEDVALAGVKKIMEYFKYEGTNPIYFQKAKIGAGAVSSYARFRASETNRMGIEIAAKRLRAPK